MGPRLVGRGKASCPEAIEDRLVKLQWGRVLWDAERRLAPRRLKLMEHASMGPRLVGRGKAHTIVPAQEGWHASMGPRLVGRGKDRIGNRIEPERNGFNGAASCGTRKGTHHHTQGRLRTIASMGPRLVGRGKVDSVDPVDRIAVASMGPRLVGRGKEPGHTQTKALRTLQWGRVLWDAERRE